MLDEYKYGLISLGVCFVSFLSYSIFYWIPTELGFPIMLISGLAAFAYLIYGWLRTHNKAKQWHLSLANYLVPHKNKVITGLIVTIIAYLYQGLIIFLSSYRANDVIRTQLNTASGGGQSAMMLLVSPQALSALNFNAFSSMFLVFFTLTYFLFPLFHLVWQKKLGKRILKIIFVCLIIFGAVFAYDMNSYGISMYQMDKGMLLMRSGNYDQGLRECLKQDQNYIILDKLILSRQIRTDTSGRIMSLQDGFKQMCQTQLSSFQIGKIVQTIQNSTRILTEDEVAQDISKCEGIIKGSIQKINCSGAVQGALNMLKMRLNATTS